MTFVGWRRRLQKCGPDSSHLREWVKIHPPLRDVHLITCIAAHRRLHMMMHDPLMCTAARRLLHVMMHDALMSHVMLNDPIVIHASRHNPAFLPILLVGALLMIMIMTPCPLSMEMCCLIRIPDIAIGSPRERAIIHLAFDDLHILRCDSMP